jgi:hypothetical protein
MAAPASNCSVSACCAPRKLATTARNMRENQILLGIDTAGLPRRQDPTSTARSAVAPGAAG